MKKAVIAFGRFNPPTTGHQKLIDKVKKLAKSENAAPLVLLSHSQDAKKNPLDYKTKLGYVRSAFGPVVKKSNAKNIFDVLKEIDNKYDSIVLVAGSDRINEYKRILNNYNGKEFNFDDWKIESAGMRDPDAEGTSGVSASKVRATAASGDFDSFVDMVPKSLSPNEKKKLYDDIRDGMGIKENAEDDIEILDEDFEFTDEEIEIALDVFEDEIFLEEDEWEDDTEELDEVLSVAQRRKRGRQLKRKAPRMARRRKIRKKRKAGPERIKARARRAARTLVKKRSGGKRKGKVSAAQKVALDKRVAKKGKQIDRLAKRLKPQIRKKERQRLQRARSRKEGYEGIMNNKKAINESFDQFMSSIEKRETKDRMALREKADEYGIPMSVVKKVYHRGLDDYQHNGRKTFTESQWAFQRVNSFLEGGKARELDEDLWIDANRINMIFEKMNITEAAKIPNDKALKAVIDTFESLNKKSGIEATDLKLEKKGASKWILTSTKGGDMTIDNKRAGNLNVSADTRGPWRLEMNKWKAKDLVNFLKKQGIEES